MSPHFDPVPNNQHLPDLEAETLKYWQEHNTFKKSVDARKNCPKYVFFDGPPFANGMPHYGHILAASLKDAVTRYWNMKGYYVPRTNGWDCHGLPVEYEIEKELELSGKKEIEEYGIDNFNSKCRESVFRYTEEWRDTIERIGRWVDFDETYATLDNDYMESIWWVFQQIWNKGLIYQDYRSMHICPRCETPLSNFEVSQGYKDVTDLSVTSKFQLTSGEHKGAFVLAWTTTPWTLPANMALCFGPEIEYVKVKANAEEYILAKALVEKQFGEIKHEIVGKVDPQELKGNTYEPLFPYYAGEPDMNRFVCVLDDYVSTEDGTGVVHIAGGFGAEDFQISKDNNLDPIIHIGIDGHFKPEVQDFAEKFVKGQEHNIAEWLEKNNKLFNKENYRHSYPHCWRCDSPLLNYSLKSWFIRVTELKDKLLENNQKINWQPSHIQEGRFGKWLENVRDWNVSRNRFWGCAIPVWTCNNEECSHQVCVGSTRELRVRSQGGNTLHFIRHGQAEHNVANISNTDPHDTSNLTDLGKEQAKKLANKLKSEGITRIFTSPFPRATQTAELIAKELGGNIEIETDERIREIAEPNGVSFQKIVEDILASDNPYTFRAGPDYESQKDVNARLLAFVDYLGSHFQNENILIVTHGAIVGAASAYFEDTKIDHQWYEDLAHINHEAVYTYHAGPVPTRDGELDLHKPYIDKIVFPCDKCNSEMSRTPEVLDCWFESGAMPYAHLHYPFENQEEFENNFPAQFIAEGLDQTRGWFYTLHVIATILFDEPAAQNIIVNGILLAKDGEKLSKRKKNYPDPNVLFSEKGVDATRLFLYQSTAPQAQDVRFSDQHVDEVFKKFNLTLWNTYSFFVTYANIDGWEAKDKTIKEFQPENELDQWILSELQAVIEKTTKAMDKYNLTEATRPFTEFLDNLSNWYIRRSRRRFWKSENDGDKDNAYTTLYIVLTEFCKLTAPFTPFISETVFRNLTGNESVHFCDWPTVNTEYHKPELNDKTQLIRQVVSMGHNIRTRDNLKVRQPLQTIEIAVANKNQEKEILAQKDVILEELNIKELVVSDDVTDKVKVIVSPNARVLGPRVGGDVQKIIKAAKAGEFELASNKVLCAGYELEPDSYELGYEAKEGMAAESADGLVVILYTELTDDLIAEGIARDLIRSIQDLRKQADYHVADRIQLQLKTADKPTADAITQFAEYITTETLAIELMTSGDLEYDKEVVVSVNNTDVTVAVKKADI